MENLSNRESITTRHADKGAWKINEESLMQFMPKDQANLALGVIAEEFPEMKALGETPLKREGILRSFKLADSLYEKLPQESIVVAMDSGKDRAKLSRHLATARLSQLENQGDKIIDMLEIDEKEITDLLADSNPDTWGPYDEMMKKEGISENEAIFRWLNDMNDPRTEVSAEISPKESSERYRILVRLIHDSIKQSDENDSGRRKSPVVLFAVGHSGSLAQAIKEDKAEITSEDIPHFCEQYKFSSDGKIVDSEKVEI